MASTIELALKLELVASQREETITFAREVEVSSQAGFQGITC